MIGNFLRSVRRILLILLGLALGLGISELALRMTHLWNIPDYSEITWYSRSTPNPNIPYLLKNNFTTSWGRGRISANSIGIRDSHIIKKGPAKYRILAIGDSVTFGFGVDDSETFPFFLEVELNNDLVNKKIEVINAGIPGFNLSDSAALLPFLIEQYQPDLVLWTLIPNDYDDSLGVDNKGNLSFTDTDYVVSADALASWGPVDQNFIDLKNFRNSMSQQALAWAENFPYLASPSLRFNDWLKANSYLYSYANTRFVGLLVKENTAHQESKKYKEIYLSPAGISYPLPPFAGVYSSYNSMKKGTFALIQSQEITKNLGIPLIFLNTALPPKIEDFNSEFLATYEELSTYLELPFYELLKNNNLGWDGHFNPDGNQTIARSIKKMLQCRGIIPGGVSCDRFSMSRQNMVSYWDYFNEKKDTFVRETYGTIDFDGFTGIHQILGGVFPPRTFPGHLSKRANFLLPNNGATELKLSGNLVGAVSMNVRITVSQDNHSQSKDFQLNEGAATISLILETSLKSKSDILEVMLLCLDPICPPSLHLKAIRAIKN